MNPSPAPALPAVPEPLQGLVDLALDVRWAWSHSADVLWRRLAPEVWERTHSPWHILQTIAQTKLAGVRPGRGVPRTGPPPRRRARPRCSAPLRGTRSTARRCRPTRLRPLRSWGRSPTSAWSSASPRRSPSTAAASASWPATTSRRASDLGVPVVGLGILWQQGYFRQALNASGEQIEFFPFNDPGQLPITPLRNSRGEWVSVDLSFPRRTVHLRVWEVRAGPGDALPARRQRPHEQRRRPGHHQRALRRRPRDAAAAGDSSWASAAGGCCARSASKPRSATSTRATPPSPSSSGRAATWRTTASGSRRRSPPPGPATSSPPTPRWRPASTASRPTSSGSIWASTSRSWASTMERLLALGAGRRRRTTVQHGLPGHQGERGGQRRQPPARRGQPPPLPASLPALAAERGAGRPRDQRGARPLLGLAGVGRALDEGLRQGPLARRPARAWTSSCGGASDEELWAFRDAARSKLIAMARDHLEPAGTHRRQPGGAGLGRQLPVRPGGVHHRLRPPVRHLQAGGPAAARPRPARAHPLRPGQHGRSSSWPARPTRPTPRARP